MLAAISVCLAHRELRLRRADRAGSAHQPPALVKSAKPIRHLRVAVDRRRGAYATVAVFCVSARLCVAATRSVVRDRLKRRRICRLRGDCQAGHLPRRGGMSAVGGRARRRDGWGATQASNKQNHSYIPT